MAHPYEQLALRVTGFCEQHGWPYYITGSVASMAYGEPRFTRDVDIVVRMPREDAGSLCEAFPLPDYYADPESAREAARRGGQFNILWPAELVKADIIAQRAGAFEEECLARARRLSFPSGGEALFSSPENVVLSKLEFFRDGGSDKHLRDIASIFKVQKSAVDQAYIESWVPRLGVQLEWRAMLARLAQPE